MNRPGLGIGALAGCLLTVPLIAVFFLGWRLAGLPFVPFDTFDHLSRILPGAVITRTIDIMVAAIGALHLGPTASAAKAAEQGIAVITFLIAGIVAAALLFAILRRERRAGHPAGLLFGVLMGVSAALAAASGHTSTVPAAAGAAWVVAMFLAWGTLLIRVRDWLTVSAADRAEIQPLNRRQFLVRMGGASAVITVIGATVGALSRGRSGGGPAGNIEAQRWSATHALPNADAEVQPVHGTRPEFTPLERHYRIDINTSPPVIREAEWQLSVSGLVEQPMTLSLEAIRKYEPMHQFITLACISNVVGGDLIGTTRWTGVSLQRVLADVRPRGNATHLKIASADGFHEVVALDMIRHDERVMLAYAWDGVPLPAEHGFPLRIYIPDRYGMKQPKWIKSIELTDSPDKGYWVVRGWDEVARMRATSVIDTVASNMMIVEGSGHSTVPVGGIAHAGARGISKVQVRVDDQPWRDARLRTPLSGTTWVIWRYDWPFVSGRHTFTVRCFEGDGTQQIEAESPPHPSGATGLQSVRAML